jgi:hypothetical protein
MSSQKKKRKKTSKELLVPTRNAVIDLFGGLPLDMMSIVGSFLSFANLSAFKRVSKGGPAFFDYLKTYWHLLTFDQSERILFDDPSKMENILLPFIEAVKNAVRYVYLGKAIQRRTAAPIVKFHEMPRLRSIEICSEIDLTLVCDELFPTTSHEFDTLILRLGTISEDAETDQDEEFRTIIEKLLEQTTKRQPLRHLELHGTEFATEHFRQLLGCFSLIEYLHLNIDFQQPENLSVLAENCPKLRVFTTNWSYELEDFKKDDFVQSIQLFFRQLSESKRGIEKLEFTIDIMNMPVTDNADCILLYQLDQTTKEWSFYVEFDLLVYGSEDQSDEDRLLGQGVFPGLFLSLKDQQRLFKALLNYISKDPVKKFQRIQLCTAVEIQEAFQVVLETCQEFKVTHLDALLIRMAGSSLATEGEEWSDNDFFVSKFQHVSKESKSIPMVDLDTLKRCFLQFPNLQTIGLEHGNIILHRHPYEPWTTNWLKRDPAEHGTYSEDNQTTYLAPSTLIFGTPPQGFPLLKLTVLPWLELNALLGKERGCKRIQWNINEYSSQDVQHCLEWVNETKQDFLEAFSLDDPHTFDGALGQLTLNDTAWHGSKPETRPNDNSHVVFFKALQTLLKHSPNLRVLELAQLAIGPQIQFTTELLKILSSSNQQLHELAFSVFALRPEHLQQLSKEFQWRRLVVNVFGNEEDEWKEQAPLGELLDNQPLTEEFGFFYRRSKKAFEREPEDLALFLQRKHNHLRRLEIEVSSHVISANNLWTLLGSCPSLQTLAIHLMHPPRSEELPDPKSQRRLADHEMDELIAAWPKQLKTVMISTNQKKLLPWSSSIEDVSQDVLWVPLEPHFVNLLQEAQKRAKETKATTPQKESKEVLLQDIERQLDVLEKERQRLNILRSSLLPSTQSTPAAFVPSQALANIIETLKKP